jgi:polysaccharide export outer membrane protein
MLIVICSCLLLAHSQQNASQPSSRPNATATTAITPQAPNVITPTLAASGPGSSGGVSATTNQAATAVMSSAEFRIGVGDLIEVQVFGAPDFDKQVRVASAGEVSLPLIGPIRLAGLTTTEAERLVEKRLLDGGYFTDPHVSIFEKEYQTQGVSVVGEVQKPGIYPMLGSHRLFDVISAAGGTTPRAGNQVSITHRDATQPAQTLILAGDGGDLTRNNPEVLPGDTVAVQRAAVVYVVGDVHLAGGFIMDKPKLTVLQALAMAQGANPTAKLNSARLIRRTGDQREEVPIDLKKILSSKAPDVSLQGDDILFVPNSAAKSAMHRGLEAIVQAATGVAIYHP